MPLAPEAVTVPLDRPARASAFAARSMLLAVSHSGAGAIVVAGERGHILLSSDAARTWTQASVPVSVTLTAVDARGEQALAVGHGLSVLRSTDGGKRWTRMLDGRELAPRLAARADAAQRAGNRKLAEKLARLSGEGPDKPLLAVVALDDGIAIAVGAYGVALHTGDGGRTWDSAIERFPGDEDRHFNAIRRVGRTLWIAGERGLLYRSNDEGRTFQAVKAPTQASFFAIDGGGATLVAAGLRGLVAISADGGATWETLDTRSTYSFTSLARDPRADGVFWAGDDSGGVWRIDARNRRASAVPLRAHGPIAALHVDDGRAAVAFGPLGSETLGTLPPTE